MARRKRLRGKLFLAVLCAGAALLVYTVFIEPDLIAVRHATIALPDWHEVHDGLVVAVLTDLHVGAPHIDMAKLRDIVEQTNEVRPDLVVLLGDYVIHGVPGGEFVPPEAIAEGLQKLRSRLGVYAVLGNHDWWYDGERVRRALQKAGIRVLEDEAVRVDHAGAAFWIVGLGDLWTRKCDVNGALAKVIDRDPVLLLTHNPDVFPDVPGRVSLTLAGHTHGGQVNLPLVGRPIVPSKFGQRYAAGHIAENGHQMYVSTGVGTSILPVRFRVVPEVVALKLVRDRG